MKFFLRSRVSPHHSPSSSHTLSFSLVFHRKTLIPGKQLQPIASLGVLPLPIDILRVQSHIFDASDAPPHLLILRVSPAPPLPLRYSVFGVLPLFRHTFSPVMGQNLRLWNLTTIYFLAPALPCSALLQLESIHLTFHVLAASKCNVPSKATVCSPTRYFMFNRFPA